MSGANGLPIAAGILIVLFGVLVVAALSIWLERRLLGFLQQRSGPNRVGPLGLLQVVADTVKIFTKENWIPPFADKAVFVLAPPVVIATALASFAVVPFAPGLIVADINVGPPLLPRDVVPRRLRRRPLGLGLQQQVLAPRLASALSGRW